MYALSLFILTGFFVAFYTYKYTWFHIIHLFESLNNASNPIPSLIHTASSANILQLIAASDDEDKVTRKHAQLVKAIARAAFTATITSTVVMIEFILIELNRDIDASSPEHTLWGILLSTIVLCLVFVQPAAMCYLLVNKIFKSNILDNDSTKLITSFSLMVIWLIFVSKSYIFTDLAVVEGAGMLSYYVQRISILGVTLMAVLNGVGSFSTVYYYLYKRLAPQQKVSTDTAKQRVQSLEKSLQNTDNMISKKEVELKNRIGDNTNDASELNRRTNLRPKGSFMDLQSLHIFNKSSSEQSTLQTEINSLKMIKNDIYVKLLRAQQTLDNQQAKLTGKSSYKDQISGIVAQCVSFYCLFKILQVSIVHSIQFFRSNDINTSKSDPLVLTLTHITEFVFTIEDEEFLINQLSFIISGVLFLCSFNGVFLTLTHLYRFLPIDLSKLDSSSDKSSSTKRNPKSVSVIKNLFVSQLMGIYVLATINILKSNLTQTMGLKLNALMLTTGLEMNVVDHWFDKVFLVSVVLTGIVIRVGEVWRDDGFEEQELMGKIV
ncbi:CYFA0S33e00122g1_1 [Cyberlindnera fabianii]|uniref:CYFA0S33e00122g1_1 n=1 Tax=Cyberlindnera fabianii TaxID=36022 RepID=A0A061BDS1_CYBFA|nr:CYFA0S33e00122g1_1 [Cyberlindnera fabianii]